MTRSWLDKEMTKRYYEIDHDHYCIVQNEYQKVKCLHCSKEQYCRLTHFWLVNRSSGKKETIWHTNYHRDLNELKHLLVQYVDGKSITERFSGNRWILEKDGIQWATEFKV